MSIPHYELLLYKGKEYDKKREMQVKQKQKDIDRNLEEMKIHRKFNYSKDCKWNSLRFTDYSNESNSGQTSDPNVRDSSVEEYENIVKTKKPESFRDYLDPTIYDSSYSTPSKSPSKAVVTEPVAMTHLWNPLDPCLDTTNLLNTSPILEEDYSDSMGNSGDKNDKNPDDYPVLYVDINLGKNRVERLMVYENEDPVEVAQVFATRTGINEKMKVKLEEMLKEQLAGLLSRINEEEDDEDM